MKIIEIGYPVSHFDNIAVTIPDRYTLSKIIGNILEMNGPVIFDRFKFSALHYRSKKDDQLIGKIRLKIDMLIDDDWNTIYLSTDESLETLEELIYKIMQKINRFPDRDVRYDVSILDLDCQ